MTEATLRDQRWRAQSQLEQKITDAARFNSHDRVEGESDFANVEAVLGTRMKLSGCCWA